MRNNSDKEEILCHIYYSNIHYNKYEKQIEIVCKMLSIILALKLTLLTSSFLDEVKKVAERAAGVWKLLVKHD